MTWRCLGLIGFAVLWFGAARAGDSDTADPPFVVATADCASAFEYYRQALYPIYFALSRDGRLCTYSYCLGGCRKHEARRDTLILCQRSDGSAPCEIYAYGGRVVSAREVTLQDRGTP